MTDATVATNRTVHTTAADGTVRDWLISPAWAVACEDLDEFLSPSGSPWGEGRWVLSNGPDVADLKEVLFARHGIEESQPLPAILEGADIGWKSNGTRFSAIWERSHTAEDGLLDWSAFCFTPEYRASIAATMIEVDQSEWRTFEVHSTGPFVLWVNGEVVLRSSSVSYMEPEVRSVRIRVPSRTSTIHLATWQVAFRECRHVARLRISGLPVRVVIPADEADEHAARIADHILASLGSESWAQTESWAELRGPAGVDFRLRTSRDAPWQRIRSDAEGVLRYRVAEAETEQETADEQVQSAGTSMLSTGESIIEVGLDDPRCPQTRRMRVAVVPADSVEHAEGSPEEWRDEVLRFVAGMREHTPTEPGVAGLLARHELSTDTRVRADDLDSALHRVLTRGDCADFEVISLLFAWHRVPAEQWDLHLREQVRSAVVGMKYWITQPGLDAMCYFTENHQFVWHVAETIAGETFSDSVFDVDGRTGAEHAAEARVRAAGWMQRKLRGGFSEFDSNAYLAIDSYALCALIEMSTDEALVQAAETLLNKVLVSLASNSWRGTHGAAHGRSYVHTLRSSRFEETSPLLRLIAGVGSMNDAVLPATGLAIARKYRIPEVVRALAGTPPEEWWGRQVYTGKLAFERDFLSRSYRSDLRVWKTPDVMLSSVQDYRAGLPGLQEHIWGATLGRELQVFVTHPANSDTGASARPNAWAGHRVLPRVHQHREVVVHLQRFTSSDPIKSTHLWLPAAQGDELAQRGEWLAIRRGDGYVAVATPGGVRPVRAGETAMQEWKPAQGGAVWVAVAGRRAVDGEFADWVESLTRSSIDWCPLGADEPGVRFAREGRPSIEVSFDGPLVIDNAVEGITEGRVDLGPHLDNPSTRSDFGDAEMVVEWGGNTLTLEIGAAIARLQSETIAPSPYAAVLEEGAR